MDNKELKGFKFKGIIQNVDKDECHIEVTSTDEKFLEDFRMVIEREFRRYNARMNEKPIETKFCSDCIHYETHYEEVVAFGEYETLTKTECDNGYDIRYEDDNYATNCPDYLET